MPRKNRVLGNKGIYHVIVKGMGNQILFEDESDKERFLSTLLRYKLEQNFELYAYCLMDNHVHLLVWDQPNKLSLIMKKINLSYVLYFNKKYERTGSLFHGRFKSELINDDKYLLTVFRYIHKNPQKAGFENYSKYKWSSYKKYTNDNTSPLITTTFISELIKSKYGDISIFNFCKMIDSTAVYDISTNHYLNDKTIISKIKRILKIESMQKIQTFSRLDRNLALKQLIELKIPLRQLERVVGISRGILKKIMYCESYFTNS